MVNISIYVLWVNPGVSASVYVQLSEQRREGRVLSRPLSCFVQCSASPTYKEKGRGGGHLPEMPALRKGNQSFAVTFYLPVPPGWRERHMRSASSC